MRGVAIVALLAVAGCGGASGTALGNASLARAVGSGGTCPDADPVRDGPYVDAIRAGNVATVDAVLARDPGDARAIAARAVIVGQGRADPNQVACFAPYFR